MTKLIDCRGLACPQPVIRTKAALEEIPAGEIVVLVDNEASRTNVLRFAEGQGHEVEISEKAPGLWALRIIKRPGEGYPIPDEEIRCEPQSPSTYVVALTSDVMGAGDEVLGRILIQAFIKTLPEVSPPPQAVIFYNRGVFLACEGSEALPALKSLAEKGVEMIACGTCLDYFGLKDRLAVGRVGNMFEIISLFSQNRVIRP
ncbi:sulfurtransferase-like selenium metabolism protein YedF [Thermosulfuriphilus sp.]